ncbi:hypothetical protein RM844_16945 [Streptomyces sp. DSM 44915]|uniref:PD-(D/E)XK endonuclease-like domain-containing protein n=1 Tax=Streptomyces chisholmiae TaxID=3075540 RepID=A0ABU2JTA9_9ACTN|nr:hypothetical protein [Streptomyces sp. DSM 44915]MDT0267969.1 hypothetical protein [Streptomyces sp. DSM 44915]
MAGQIRTIHRGGSRFYVAPDGAKVPGVTSVVAMLPRPFLVNWAARMTAEAAVDQLAAVTSIAERDRSGAVDYLKGAHRRYTQSRADIGSEAHDTFERQIRGERVGRVHRDIEPYRVGFAEFLESVRPELVRAEDVAWSDRHDYAGSFDALLRVRLDENGKPDENGEPALLVADWKTSRATYPDVGLQMTAYARADRIIAPDGTSEPMPAVDGAAVLHIRPEGWSFKPVRSDDEVFDVFLSLRHIFEWDREISRTVVGTPMAQSGGRFVTGTQRRAR